MTRILLQRAAGPDVAATSASDEGKSKSEQRTLLEQEASQIDGEWTGTFVVNPDSREFCSIESVPFRAWIEGRRFIGTATDPSEKTLTFEGQVDRNGELETWGGPWVVVNPTLGNRDATTGTIFCPG